MENRKEQILAFNQESLVEDKSLKLKVYNYFYLILKSKGKINSFILFISYYFHILRPYFISSTIK